MAMMKSQSLKYAAALILAGFISAMAVRAQTATPSPAATPPASDILLVDLTKEKSGFKLGQPAKITTFAGYNNQPFFLPDGSAVLYTSIRDGQADIYRYDIRSGAPTQITNTRESEYSPTLMPDGKNIPSCALS